MPERVENVEERWRALWETSPQRSPFSRLSYVRAVADAAGLRLNLHFVPGRDGGDAGGAAVTWRRRGPYREVVVPPYTPYSAVLLREHTAESDIHTRSSPLGALLRELERTYHGVQAHLHPSLTDVRPATWRGWEAQPLYTYVFSVSADIDVQRRWSDSTARNFRNARDDFELLEGPEAGNAAAALTTAGYDRHGRPAPLPEAALRNLIDRTSDMSTAYAVRRRGGDQPVLASVVTLADAGRAYYWIAGSVPGDAMTVLVGELLSRIDPSRFPIFDFVGANTPSIAEFKRRFGCSLETYYRIVYYGRKDLKLLYVLRDIF